MAPKKDKKGKGKGKKGGTDGGMDELIDEMFYFPPEHEKQRREKAVKRIKEAFKLFERDNNGTCDVREIGTIVRSLGLNPTDQQLRNILEEIEEDEPTGFIKYSKFEPLMLDILLTDEYRPTPKDGKEMPSELMVRNSEDLILQAFEVFDPEKKGYLDSEQLKELLTSQGEAFSNEEVIEMLNAAADPETGFIKYDDYVATLACD
uniref:EF-hand domain-containing protein n=1 Tax=Eutreptiella gymnastica TaxID=73025 RepID=A0A7S4FQB2_9EUGL|mmetsp:Transcript_39110/g.64929  ORF Transcript_39110/g.64929 Transcript_39110/m.64929 type:complete len:205 (+) Transcript_39110:20-634(+)